MATPPVGFFRGGVTVAVLALLTRLHLSWQQAVNSTVPTSYLDEVFHIPQAQAYWRGRWAHWDDKITTPPGLYFFSYVFNVLQGGIEDDISVESLRRGNAVLLYLLGLGLCFWSAAAPPSTIHGRRAMGWMREINVAMFPLLFFFSGLYYTDLFSAFTVVLTMGTWHWGVRSQQRRWLFRLLHVVFGLVSLTARQTNIFWVAIFLGGLQVVESVKTRAGKIHDPAVRDTHFEDIPTMCISLTTTAFGVIPYLVVDILPQLVLLGAFGGFVLWNEGVVLGDKSNHVATIHTPQMLYIWPCITFFSWPLLLPQLSSWSSLRARQPRTPVVLLTVCLMAASVHYNTIVHPFILADNRHYVFYVFRILMRPWWVKYAAVPVYAGCAWLIVNAFAGTAPPHKGTSQVPDDGSVRLSFVIIWTVSTALSLMTAPLVEPRYFILPWLVWRMYVPELGTSAEERERPQSVIRGAVKVLARYALWIELGWYLTINAATCWMFLHKGFQWSHEPGKVQRFMW